MSIRRSTFGALGLFFTLMVTSSASAQADKSRRTFYDPVVLRKVMTDIAQMEEPELRGFVRYFSECGNGGIEATIRHACRAAMRAYEMEFGGKRAVDDWIYAKSIMEEVELGVPNPKINDTTAMVDDAVKYGLIISSVEEAVRNRFRAIASARK